MVAQRRMYSCSLLIRICGCWWENKRWMMVERQSLSRLRKDICCWWSCTCPFANERAEMCACLVLSVDASRVCQGASKWINRRNGLVAMPLSVCGGLCTSFEQNKMGVNIISYNFHRKFCIKSFANPFLMWIWRLLFPWNDKTKPSSCVSGSARLLYVMPHRTRQPNRKCLQSKSGSREWVWSV